MDKIRKMIGIVDAMARKLDPDVIVQRTFYDQASCRLFVSMVKGRREHEVMLAERHFNNPDLDKVEKMMRAGILRLQHQPIS